MSHRSSIPKYPSFEEFVGRYNTAGSDDAEVPVHCNVANPPALRPKEYSKLELAVGPVLQRFGACYGCVFPVPDEPVSFSMGSDYNDDRTLVVTILNWRFDPTTEFLIALQGPLQNFPLWRICIGGDARDEVIYIYPTTIRLGLLASEESLNVALDKISENRRRRRPTRPLENIADFPWPEDAASSPAEKAPILPCFSFESENKHADGTDADYAEFHRVRNSLVRVCRRHGSTGPTGEFRFKSNPLTGKEDEDDFEFESGDETPLYYLRDDMLSYHCFLNLHLHPRGATRQWLVDVIDELRRHAPWGIMFSNVRFGFAAIFGQGILVRGPLFDGCANLDDFLIVLRDNLFQ